MNDTTKNFKEIAADFLQLCSSGSSVKAFEMYVAESFKHHNAFYKGDAETLMLAMEISAIKHPEQVLLIKNIVHEIELVAVHSHVIPYPGKPGFALMHIFRFRDDKIVELWDFGQEVPENIVNENGMF